MDTANVANATFTDYFFYDTTGLGASLVADNSPQPLTAAMAAKMIGYVTFTLVTGGAGSTMAEYYSSPNLKFTTGNYSQIFMIMTATGAYTPKNGGTITQRITFSQ